MNLSIKYYTLYNIINKHYLIVPRRAQQGCCLLDRYVDANLPIKQIFTVGLAIDYCCASVLRLP